MTAVTRTWLSSRLRELGEAERFGLDYMPLKDSSHWALRDGGIRHRSGRFFSVIGVRAETQSGALVEQPLLDQREIGILAIFLRQHHGQTEVLTQCKAEPGNVGLFQLAPSYQATASNTDRVHGGASPLLGDWLGSASAYVTDTLQSEQGTRFFGKRNRNVSLLVRGAGQTVTSFHAWIPARELCGLLAENHLINTDLRSTLACADWAMLGNGQPFGGTGFAQRLRASYELGEHQAMTSLAEVRRQLTQPVEWRRAPEIVPLGQLTGWLIGDEGPAPRDGSGRPFRLRHIRVHSASREVQDWDQPIVQSGGRGEAVLPVGFHHDVPYLLFKQVAEPGFGFRSELTPAVLREPGAIARSDSFGALLTAGARTIISCRQSEEGGRFLFDENEYALADVGAVIKPPPGYHWLSLAQTRALLLQGCVFTNEARSALSLLLKWL